MLGGNANQQEGAGRGWGVTEMIEVNTNTAVYVRDACGCMFWFCIAYSI